MAYTLRGDVERVLLFRLGLGLMDVFATMEYFLLALRCGADGMKVGVGPLCFDNLFSQKREGTPRARVA